MKLTHLLDGLTVLKTEDSRLTGLSIEGLADSSQEVKKGFLFIAIKGFKEDGHRHIQHAINKGAAAIIGEREISSLPVPYIQVPNSRIALGILAKNFYRNPASRKIMIGITGTNGKTTTSYLIKHLMEQNGFSCSVLGTIQNIVNGEAIKSDNTTPNSLVLQEMLSLSNDDAVIMEVSSHGLTQHRIEGIQFDLCLFTNLNHDHLDYHGSMESYFKAKSILFDHLKTDGTAIINTDDEWGHKLKNELLAKSLNVLSLGRSQESTFRIRSLDPEESIIHLDDGHETLLQSPMAGTPNMYNSLMAYAAAISLNIPKGDLIRSMGDFKGVEGRFESAETAGGAIVIVDYAHTPDAIYHCLKTAKEAGAKRIIHIFGFRGDRDSSKRKEIIEATAKISDEFIITTDDLNTVPQEKMREISSELAGTYGNEKGIILMDRTLAIEQAINKSIPGDWIVITGKGHEKYKHEFQLPTHSDKETVRYLLKDDHAF